MLAIASAANAPSLVSYQNRTTEATQIIAGAPDSLVGKLCVGRNGNGYSYHQKTSGDGTLLSHYSLIEDVAALAAVRVAEVDARTAELIAGLSDLPTGVALKAQINAAVNVSALDAIVDNRTVGGETPVILAGSGVGPIGTSGAVSIDCGEYKSRRGLLTGNVTGATLENMPGVGTEGRVSWVWEQAAAASYTIPLVIVGVTGWTNPEGGPVMPSEFGAIVLISVYMNGTERIGSWSVPGL